MANIVTNIVYGITDIDHFQDIIPYETDDVLSDEEWRLKNWGTKKNRYDVEKGIDHVVFGTDWKHPFPIIKKLSKGCELIVMWADECMEDRVGGYIICDGKIVDKWKSDKPYYLMLAINQLK